MHHATNALILGLGLVYYHVLQAFFSRLEKILQNVNRFVRERRRTILSSVSRGVVESTDDEGVSQVWAKKINVAGARKDHLRCSFKPPKIAAGPADLRLTA